MPGFLLHIGATVLCAHGGQAQPGAPFPRVLVSGQPVVAQPVPWIVAGCPFVPSAGNGPCVTGQWITGTVRVLAGGMPLTIMTGVSVCVPTGTPMQALAAQTRVMGA
jgi:hypothetical protein